MEKLIKKLYLKDSKLATEVSKVLGVKIKAKFSIKDNILDSITFEDLLDTVVSNIPKEKYSKETVAKQFKTMLRDVLQDSEYVLKNNMKEILNSLEKGYY